MEEMHQPQQVGPNMMANVSGVPNHSNNVNRRSRVRLSLHNLMVEKLPINEAVQLEMKSLCNKTPVSILQELLSRRDTTPKYELIQVEGAIHEPIFRYRVTVADIVAMGTGKSKKEAKHAAARAVLDKLCRLNSDAPDSPLANNIPDSENLQELPGYGEEKIITNPIGALQEMCMSRHWPPPKYSMENEEGLPHERKYTIVCSILKYREVGQGKSKKVAKRHAAHKMWQALHDMNTESSNVDEDEVLQRNANVNARYADLKGSKISTLTTIHSLKVSQFHKSLKSSTGVKLFELQNTCLNDGDVNLVQFLQEIASEQQFEVTYVDIEEKSISGKCQCLVQLSTLPVAVCYGCGVTSKDAQASAAQNALEYLKIMTKNLLSKNQNNADPKILSANNQVSDKGKSGQKLDHVGNKSRLSKLSIRTVNAGVGNKDASLNTITATSGVTVPASRINPSIKKISGNNESLKSSEQLSKSTPMVSTNQSSSKFSSVRNVAACVGGSAPHENAPKSKDYSGKKYSGEMDSKMKNYQMQPDYKDSSVNNQDYKARNSAAMNNIPSRYGNQPSVQALHRENHGTSSAHHSRPASRNDNTAFAVARKALEQQNPAAKMAPINFPPLRAPQSIVNVRHPFVTEARTKHNELAGPSSKSKLNVGSPLQGSVKDLDHGRQTFHGYGASQIAGIPNVQSLGNVTASMSPYPRPDSFPQPTVASVLFPDTSQFPQSPPFSTTQIGQLNQYQTYDPGSFATTPVNVNPVIPQFSAESSIPYPQYDNTPQFVQPNHYPTADLANSQYQYQAASVGQLQDSPMFIQSLQSPIAVTDQYAAPNYARTVRTELIPRLRRPPRFNK